MTEPVARVALRRSNPVITLVVGVLIGALLTAIARQPAPSPSESVRADGSGAAAERGAVDGQSGDSGGFGADGLGGDATSGSAVGASAGGAAGRVGVVGGGAGPGGAPAAVCAGTQRAGVPGITDNAVKIGFAVPDLGVLAALVDVGDIEAYTRAVLAALTKEGRFPVCGRKIEPFFRTYNVLDPAESRAACVGFTDEDKVFAVFALFAFSAADCVAREKGRIMFDAGQALTEPSYAASPLLFAAQPPIERQLRAYSGWVVRNGIAPGKKTGVYYVTDGPGGSAPPGQAVKKALIDELAKLGHPIDVVVATDGCGAFACPDPNDRVALQRFQSENVEVVYMMNYKASIIQQAESQGYRPQWVLLGTAMASDATTGNVPPENFDGALGMLFEHVGEELAGIPQSSEEKRCFGWWTSQGNPRPESRDSAAGQSLRQVCDQVDLLARSLAGAGKNLTPDSMITGFETIRALPMAYQANLSFLPGKHWGAASNLIVRWSKDCTCWKSTGPFVPLFGR